MRILAVLYCYPPLLVPAAVCYAKLMEGLRVNGVDIEIVTIAPESFASPGAPILLDHDLAEVSRSAGVDHVIHSPETSPWVLAAKRLDPTRRLTYRWLEPKKREWTVPALRYLRTIDLSKYDALLTCSQPHANHLVGLELREATRMPWIAYFSDPWTDSPYVHFASKHVRNYNRMLEDRILRTADLVLYTCAEMRDLVQRNHPALDSSRTGLLPHTFIPDWYVRDPAPAPPDGPLRLLQTGSFYGPRTPLPLIQALQRLNQQIPLAGRLRIDSYGDMEPEYRDLIARSGLADVLNVHGYVPYLKTLSMMKSYDALLLVDAPLTTASESVFLPSKLIDYLGSGAPILAVTPGHGATARVVRETGGAVCPLETPQALDGFLLEALRTRKIPLQPHADAVAQYHYREVGRSLLGMMEGCIRRIG